jgi:hypothetical protein
MMSRIDSRHWKISTGLHFQNGHHNTTQIQQCPISSKFDMLVDNDVPNWFQTLSYLWNRTMLNFCGIVAAILKMKTGRNFSMSGINLGHHNLPTYEISLKSNNVEFEWCPKLIPDIEKFLPVAIFKMTATISHKFNIVRFQRHFICREIFRCRESIRDIIIYLHMKFRWNRTMLNLCGIIATILKMETSRNFSMSTMQSVHLNLLSVAGLGDFIIIRL